METPLTSAHSFSHMHIKELRWHSVYVFVFWSVMH